MADPRSAEQKSRDRRQKHATYDPTVKKRSKRVGNFIPNIPIDATHVQDRRFDNLAHDILNWFTSNAASKVKAPFHNPARFLPFDWGVPSHEELGRRLNKLTVPTPKRLLQPMIKAPSVQSTQRKRPVRSPGPTTAPGLSRTGQSRKRFSKL